MSVNRGRSHLLILPFVCALALPLARAADSASDATAAAAGDTSSSSSQPAFAPPPEFRAMATLQMGNMIKCMTTPALNTIGDLFTKGMKETVAQGAGTCGKEYSVDASGLTCERFQDAAGNFSREKLDQAEGKIDAAIEALSCRKGKIEKMKDELSCLSSEANMLAQQIGALQSAYTSNLQRAERDVATLTSMEEDRKAQHKDVTGKLTGEGISGGKGLLGLREEMQKAIAGMPKQVQDIKEAQIDLERQRRALEEMSENRKMVLANACFERPKTLKCTPNGKPVNAREYVLCRYNQNQRVGRSGVVNEGKLAGKQADSKSQELELILNSIVEDSPADLGKAKSPEEVQSLTARPVKITTVRDIENRYGAQLASFNGNGLDIKAFVMNTLSNCFTEAENSVKRERKSPNSNFTQAQEAIKKRERETVVHVNELLNGYSQLNSEVMAGLTGMHLPLNISACQNAKPSVQANCLDDIRRNMEGMLAGSTPQSAVSVQIRGNDPKTAFTFQCQGLNGCITYMQNAQRKLQEEVQRVGAFKKDYILKANQSVDQFTNNMAQILSPQSAQLNNRIQQLNATLATMGVRPGIKIGQVKGKPLRKGENGLYEMPENVLDLVGSKMNPAMRDVQGEDFSGALDGIAEKVDSLDEKAEKLASAKDTISGVARSCSRDILRDLGKDVKEYKDCYYEKEDCTSAGQETSISQDIAAILEKMGSLSASDGREFRSIPAALKSGSEAACQKMEGFAGSSFTEKQFADCLSEANKAEQANFEVCSRQLLGAEYRTGDRESNLAKLRNWLDVVSAQRRSEKVDCLALAESIDKRAEIVGGLMKRGSASAASAAGGKKH